MNDPRLERAIRLYSTQQQPEEPNVIISADITPTESEGDNYE